MDPCLAPAELVSPGLFNRQPRICRNRTVGSQWLCPSATHLKTGYMLQWQLEMPVEQWQSHPQVENKHRPRRLAARPARLLPRTSRQLLPIASDRH